MNVILLRNATMECTGTYVKDHAVDPATGKKTSPIYDNVFKGIPAIMEIDGLALRSDTPESAGFAQSYNEIARTLDNGVLSLGVHIFEYAGYHAHNHCGRRGGIDIDGTFWSTELPGNAGIAASINNGLDRLKANARLWKHQPR